MPTRLPVVLPEVEYHDPAAFATEPIFGPHGVTAHVFPMARVLDWQEHRAVPYQGYYRLIHPPFVKRLRARLQAHYGVDWAIPYSSPELAAKELFDFLRLQHPQLRVCEVEGANIPDAIRKAAGLQPVVGSDLEPFAAGDVLLFDESVARSNPSLLAAARTARAVLIGYSPSLPATREAVDFADGWLATLDSPEHGLTGGVVLIHCNDQAPALYERNRRRGGLFASRAAAWWLGEPIPDPRPAVVDEVAGMLAQMENASHAFLYPSGMHGIVEVFETLWSEEKPEIIVLGHPYSDTHLILGEMPWALGTLRTYFLQVHELDRLSQLLASGKVAGVLMETLTNPLIEIPDLPAIAAACHKAQVPLVVDNTFATPANCQPLNHGATIVLHSTSKFLSGSNEHGGGVVMTSDSDIAARLAERQARLRNRMSPFEAAELLKTLPTFPDRMIRFNANGRRVAALLAKHPAVKRVYFPVLPGQPTPTLSWLSGFGSVVSFVLHEEGLSPVQRLYDFQTPTIRKAPTLGSDVTLLCPYVMLTYYTRNDEYLAAHGLPRYLVRIATGSEKDFDPVEKDLLSALAAAMQG